ncbi:hypothetical protein BC939DRAFT_472713 [Gamsiella multidivaricata]|uniref:uncharacterized protein n=1 Tax=Gamsiella multidivaricata TaxID=101098 RepID=UPI002220057C|nr:uncharacterized protein BC939DRAFT_472713 [Gamsiella multidivaricata]KAG0362190.1 hypothetical protein BGZ54_008743 [Gamsiella multidivaricata]KAI7832499.1 hypothetical protein BC939DRAFT_472713 [Gamsiella multidivaricata]
MSMSIKTTPTKDLCHPCDHVPVQKPLPPPPAPRCSTITGTSVCSSRRSSVCSRSHSTISRPPLNATIIAAAAAAVAAATTITSTTTATASSSTTSATPKYRPSVIAAGYDRPLSRMPPSMSMPPSSSSMLVKHKAPTKSVKLRPSTPHSLPDPPPVSSALSVYGGCHCGSSTCRCCERDVIYEGLRRDLADAEFEYEECICLPRGCTRKPEDPPENCHLQRLWYYAKDLADYMMAVEQYLDDLQEGLKAHVCEKMRRRERAEAEERKLKHELEIVKARALYLTSDK